ncbi:MAG: hydroxymethylbilane synthase [Deltaproteobacteria bacterium]|nr:hydroxymethylbilane synthase [Deltaproteobacteria bacterium]MCL5791808.1 hydroxymethylbilane synthase [Deltaproteobacteria bacterium]
MKIKIGTRGSKLALWQANYVKSLIESVDHDINVELVIIKTSGDAIQDVSLTDIGGKGLFVKEIEKALLSKEVDIAVHSMKDMPADIPGSLYIAATPPAESPWDAIIFNKPLTFTTLKPHSVIGTTSLRRIVQIKRLNNAMDFKLLRGNVDTRIKKMNEGSYDAVIVAYAGINRLGIKPEFIERLDIIPAAGQGIIAIQIHKDSNHLIHVLNMISHTETFIRSLAERGFTTRIGGSCNTPLGAHAELSGADIIIKGFVASPDGGIFYSNTVKDKQENAYKTGETLAETLLELGAAKILNV